MKYIIFAILFSANLYSQSDSTFKKTSFFKKVAQVDKGVPLCVGAIMLPAVITLAAGSDDKFSKYAAGTMGVVAGFALAMGTYKAVKENPKVGKRIANYSCMFLGGASEGFSEELQHHYWKVKIKFPNMNDQFFDPSISWKNKYKNGDPSQGEAYFGSTTMFVAGTDGFHAFRAVSKGFLIGGLITFQKGKTFWRTVGEAVISMGFYSLGKGSAHYLINN
jgi:hypothetical protein